MLLRLGCCVWLQKMMLMFKFIAFLISIMILESKLIIVLFLLTLAPQDQCLLPCFELVVSSIFRKLELPPPTENDVVEITMIPHVLEIFEVCYIFLTSCVFGQCLSAPSYLRAP